MNVDWEWPVEKGVLSMPLSQKRQATKWLVTDETTNSGSENATSGCLLVAGRRMSIREDRRGGICFRKRLSLALSLPSVKRVLKVKAKMGGNIGNRRRMEAEGRSVGYYRRWTLV